jgi:SAM-dependent methyltransferase
MPQGGVLVDVGCGESDDAALARERGFVAFGVDVIPPRRERGRASFVQADAAELPFADGSVDGVLSHAMVALLSPADRWAMFHEVARVLKPNGFFSFALYPLSDGHPIQAAVEASRVYESGLHRKRMGLYAKCSNSKCTEHPHPDSFDAVLRGLRMIDSSPDFVDTASLFVAWVMRGGSPSEAAKFAGVSQDAVFTMIKGAQDCGIFDANEGTLSLPWLDHYIKDENSEGNISLVLDVLAIRGEISRTNDAEGLRYCAKEVKNVKPTSIETYKKQKIA